MNALQSRHRAGGHRQRRTALNRLRTLVPAHSVSALRLVWVIAIVWYELGAFLWSVARCRWPDAAFRDTLQTGPGSARTPTHVLLVADPQVIDARSYPDRPYWLSALSQFAVDLNLRKSWAATRRFAPDVIVFLGDMMDNGRYASGDQEYREYYERFRSIFATDPSTAVHYIAGNHDVGLGSSQTFSPQSRKRYTTHFGPLNYQLSIANHTLVMVDAPGLVEEDYIRTPTGQTFEDWTPPPGGATDFINKFASVGTEEPVVLFTHIPLFRPDTAPCGPLRERGTIRRGVGYGYQNTLGRQTTDYLLKYVRPALVFSGDDHDYCEYVHSIPLLSEGPEPKIEYVREVTVKSISMAMGIQRPGFQLLSLVPPSELTPNARSFADAPCLLPDQLSIYLNRYVPLVIISLIIIGISNYRGLRSRKARPVSFDIESDLTPPLSLQAPPTFGNHQQKMTQGGARRSGAPSPESVPINLSTARTPYNMATGTQNGTQLARTYRASNCTGPNTPDYISDGAPAPSADKISAVPDSTVIDIQQSGADEYEDEYGDGDGDEIYDRMARVRYASRHDGGAGGDSGYRPSGQPGRGRAWSRFRFRFVWTWSFVFRGRRWRLTVGAPPAGEQVCRGERAEGGRSGVNVRRGGLVVMFVRDVLAVAWPPVLVFVLITYKMFRSS